MSEVTFIVKLQHCLQTFWVSEGGGGTLSNGYQVPMHSRVYWEEKDVTRVFKRVACEGYTRTPCLPSRLSAPQSQARIQILTLGYQTLPEYLSINLLNSNICLASLAKHTCVSPHLAVTPA